MNRPLALLLPGAALALLLPGAALAQNTSRPVTVRQGGHQIEYFLEGKGGPSKSRSCEDGLFFNEHFLAVVDGATDKSGQRYDKGLKPGQVSYDDRAVLIWRRSAP